MRLSFNRLSSGFRYRENEGLKREKGIRCIVTDSVFDRIETVLATAEKQLDSQLPSSDLNIGDSDPKEPINIAYNPAEDVDVGGIATPARDAVGLSEATSDTSRSFGKH